MAMSIARKLMLACAGVVVGGLGFLPSADASMTISVKLDPTPPVNSTSYKYVPFASITWNAVDQRYEVPATATANRYVLFDIVGTVTGNPNLVRTGSGTRIDPGKLATDDSGPYTPFQSFLAQGVLGAKGTIGLSGYNAVLAPNAGVANTKSQLPGLIKGKYNNSGVVSDALMANYADGNITGTVGKDGTSFQNRVGPLAGVDSAAALDPTANNYVFFNSLFGDGIIGGQPGLDGDMINTDQDGMPGLLPMFPVLGDPQLSQESFLLGKVSLWFGNNQANGGVMQVAWVPANVSNPNILVADASSWVEDYVTGLSLDGNGKLKDNGSNGFYTTSGLKTTGLTVEGLNLAVVPIPEPATLGLFAVGALVCGLRRNRRK